MTMTFNGYESLKIANRIEMANALTKKPIAYNEKVNRDDKY